MTNTTTNKDVTRRRDAAYWYAVGRVEAEGGPDRSDDFAKFAEAQAEAYYGGETWFLGSVSSQWTEFLTYQDDRSKVGS